MKGSRFIVLRLSLADLRHEWILSTCLVMAVAAVLAPLLILFGLKFGTIEIMRDRLIEDPRNREIRPMVSRSFERDWFEFMAARKDVQFVVPFTRQISAQVDARLKTGLEAPRISLDLLPTAEGDPLLTENGATVPGNGQCVLSSFAAEALGVEVGDVLVVEAKRLKGSDYEKAGVELEVAGVTMPRATVLKSIYVPLPFLEAVESYKDGQAVSEYGWPGSRPLAYPVYDGLAVVLGEPLSRVDEFRLVNNTGFVQKELLTAETMATTLGWRVQSGRSVYLASTKNKPVDEESVRAVEHALRGEQPVLVPWVRPLEAVLLGPDGAELASLSLHVLSMNPEDAQALELEPAIAWGAADEETPSAQWRRVMLPKGLDVPENGLRLRFARSEEQGGGALEFPVWAEAGYAAQALVPARLAGVLHLYQQRNLIFDESAGEFLLARRGYAGFRLYAATIDDVERLRRELDDQGLAVSTEAERIRDVKELDAYLTLIFVLIAGVALVGGAASLMASLYASVERKRRDLSVLRLLGLSGPTLLRFPIYQGAFIAAAGFGVALTFFEFMSVVINTLFSDHLQARESLCRLEPAHLAAALAGTVLVAVVAGSVAAWRATRIEPAEALRDE
ncbi:MAG: ABC transporter permease [Desulfovibrionaceae bacterium]